MSRRRKLKIVSLTVASVLATCAITALSTASADTCSVAAVLPTGQRETFVVNAAPGTPPPQMVPAGVQYQSVSASCAPDTPTTANSTQPRLFDLTGDLRFGPATDSLGALIVYGPSGPVGRFVDDTTTNESTVIQEEYAAGVPLIIAAIPPGTPHVRFAHALNAQEWYPYNSGYAPRSWGPMPRARAYILQWRFSFTGPPPTLRERMKLLRQARRSRPMLIIGY